MKKYIIIGLAIAFIAACEEKKPERYTQESPQINTVKQLIGNYNKKTYDTSIYADTSKTYYNSKENPLSPEEVIAYHKERDMAYSQRSFLDKDQEYEMVLTDDGETWVNCWLDWQGTLAGNGQVVNIPIHLTYRFQDDKIVREVGMWDPSAIMLAIQEMEMKNSMSADEKAIQTTIDNVTKAWNANNKDLMYANLVKNVTRMANGVTIAKKQSDYGDFMDIYHGAFPDFKVILDKTVIDGNKAYLNWTCTGTNKGEFLGNPPTNKKIETHGFSVWEFDTEGKAVREDAFYDNLVVYEQLGYSMPMPK
ncbi:ester cyclase [Arenibacter palladensis]|uniref:ester cyclase n=1 Tax=Arenibacter palladensis TaxID=237373 RepID=UPI0026E14726|nr:ester cyclase [Arenibacter palladensis]MDO6604785.1 ester cyclase [Arenibacter palladensis]